MARSGAVAVSVGDVVYIFGGDDGTKTVNSVEKYNIKLILVLFIVEINFNVKICTSDGIPRPEHGR